MVSLDNSTIQQKSLTSRYRAPTGSLNYETECGNWNDFHMSQRKSSPDFLFDNTKNERLNFVG